MRLFRCLALAVFVVLLWTVPAPATIRGVKLTNPGGHSQVPTDTTMSFAAWVLPKGAGRTSIEFWLDRARPSKTRACAITLARTTNTAIVRACRVDFSRFGVGIHTAQAVATEEATGTRLWSNVVLWRKLPADPQPAPPWRGAFYYPWYPQSWSVGTHFTPQLGRYASGETATIDRHLDMLRYGRFEVGISSWWSPQHHTNANLPLMLDRVLAARVGGFRWTVYYECEGNDSSDSPACGPTKDPSVRQLTDHITYLWRRYGGHPKYMRIWRRMVVFVYSAGDGPSPGDDPADPCEVLRRWKQAQMRAGIDVYLVMKVFSGYRNCPNQPESWHQYGPSTGVQAHEDANGNLVSYVISPGFWHADDPTPTLPRNIYAWRHRVRNMNASSARWKLVTTFDEWGEGTAIEAANEWPSTSGYGDYLDVLHSPG